VLSGQLLGWPERAAGRPLWVEFRREQPGLSCSVAGNYQPHGAASACQRRSCVLGISGFFHPPAATDGRYRSGVPGVSHSCVSPPTDHGC